MAIITNGRQTSKIQCRSVENRYLAILLLLGWIVITILCSLKIRLQRLSKYVPFWRQITYRLRVDIGLQQDKLNVEVHTVVIFLFHDLLWVGIRLQVYNDLVVGKFIWVNVTQSAFFLIWSTFLLWPIYLSFMYNSMTLYLRCMTSWANIRILGGEI